MSETDRRVVEAAPDGERLSKVFDLGRMVLSELSPAGDH